MRKGATRERDSLVLVFVKFANGRFEAPGGPEISVKLAATHFERLMQAGFAIILKRDKPRKGNPREYIFRWRVLKERQKELVPKIVASHEVGKLPR